MTDRFSSMINYKSAESTQDVINSTKELLQEMILAGLSRARFFDIAAFNGGTALRILYKLDRFSEDLDFTLLEKDLDFTFRKYIPYLKTEFDAMGLNVSFKEISKTRNTGIASSKLEGNARELIITLGYDERLAQTIHKDANIKIKFEVSLDPPECARLERRIKTLPIYYMITSYDLPTLFAVKISALLCRKYLHREKGRDFYDFAWYVNKMIPLNLEHLECRLRKVGCIGENEEFNLNIMSLMLTKKFEKTDYTSVIEDIIRFVSIETDLSHYCKEYFIGLIPEIRIADYSRAIINDSGETNNFAPGTAANRRQCDL